MGYPERISTPSGNEIGKISALSRRKSGIRGQVPKNLED